MLRLILVKHSLPEIVPDIPSAKWHLSDEGRRRALVLAGRLSSFEPSRVVSSHEPKAVETADKLIADVSASSRNLDSVEVMRLRMQDLGRNRKPIIDHTRGRRTQGCAVRRWRISSSLAVAAGLPGWICSARLK